MKNNKLTLLLLSFLLLSLASCDDDPVQDYHTTVQGRILEYGTEEPITGAKVILIEKEVSLSGGISYPIDTLITDETGAYAYRFFDKPGFSYWIDVIKEGYHELPTPFYDFQPNRVNDADILLDPLAALELHIKNINPFDENDRLSYGVYWEDGAFPEPLIGKNIDKYITRPVRGNRYIKIFWYATKNNIQEGFEDSTYCIGGDVTKYELFY